ncbi:unnamed protein product [Calypogeia fissa]
MARETYLKGLFRLFPNATLLSGDLEFTTAVGCTTPCRHIAWRIELNDEPVYHEIPFCEKEGPCFTSLSRVFLLAF